MKKILIIEDERALARMYKEKFLNEGFEVFLAFDAKEGLEMAKEKKPDLIILDILLPGENGIFFLKELRKLPEISNLKVVAFSNFDDPKAKKEALDLKILDYLIKTNYTPKEFVEKIKSYLK